MTSVADHYLKLIRDSYKTEKTKKIKSKSHNSTIENLPGEIWKTIEGYDYYKISNMGRIVSTGRGHPKLLKTWRVVTTSSPQPQWRAELSKNKKKRTHPLHRLVAEAFCTKPDTKEELRVAHLDLNNDNNVASNLKWITAKESRQRAYDLYERANITYYNNKSLQQISKELGGERGLVSNRVNKCGWCLECACTIPVQKRYKDQACPHV